MYDEMELPDDMDYVLEHENDFLDEEPDVDYMQEQNDFAHDDDFDYSGYGDDM